MKDLYVSERELFNKRSKMVANLIIKGIADKNGISRNFQAPLFFIYDLIDVTKIEVNRMEFNGSWTSLNFRHKARVILSLILAMLGIIDIFVNVFSLPLLERMYVDLLWIIGSIGLLGTSVYLAMDARD